MPSDNPILEQLRDIIAKASDFDAKVAALMAQGHSKESASAIAASMCGKSDTSKSLSLTILKSLEPKKQIALAVTNIVSKADGTPVADHQDDVIKIGNLEDKFIEAFAPASTETSGVMHEARGDELARVVQHMTFSREDWAALAPYIGMEIGVVKIQVANKSVWAAVKSGQLAEVSIEGDGERTPL